MKTATVMAVFTDGADRYGQCPGQDDPGAIFVSRVRCLHFDSYSLVHVDGATVGEHWTTLGECHRGVDRVGGDN